MILVCDEIEADGLKPGAEVWSTNRAYFTSRAFGRVVERWCEVTGCLPELFPWSEDAVVTTWVSWRKASGEKERQIREELMIGPDDVPGTLEFAGYLGDPVS